MNTAPCIVETREEEYFTLLEQSLPELREVTILESDNEVVLSGSVSSFYSKQLAQEAIRNLAGPRRLHNRIHVRA